MQTIHFNIFAVHLHEIVLHNGIFSYWSSNKKKLRILKFKMLIKIDEHQLFSLIWMVIFKILIWFHIRVLLYGMPFQEYKCLGIYSCSLSSWKTYYVFNSVLLVLFCSIMSLAPEKLLNLVETWYSFHFSQHRFIHFILKLPILILLFEYFIFSVVSDLDNWLFNGPIL